MKQAKKSNSGNLFFKKFFFFQLFFAAGIFFYSCSPEEPIDQEKMIRIYTDLVLAQDSLKFKSNIQEQNSLPDFVKLQIFSRHNVSPRSYEEAIDFYNEKPERWESFFSRAIVYLDSLKRAADR